MKTQEQFTSGSEQASASSASLRAEAQRDRILQAARKCFVEHGFHAASMANIAETSGMSAGLIYRYFQSKHAIILAIIDRQLQEIRADIAQMETSTDLVESAVELFAHWRDGNSSATNAPLFLEITAEASRDVQIAEALRRSDLITGAEFRAWLARSAEEGGLGLAPELAEVRALALQCLIEGLAIRAIRQPDLDLATLRAMLERVLSGLMSDGPLDPDRLVPARGAGRF